jgi:hypothetical protein
MKGLGGAAVAAAFGVLGLLATGGWAGADVVIAINKSSQRMAVIVDGAERHVWKVSTGLGGGPPSGTYRPERMERKWYSHKYNWSPMPHAIFFHQGYAIHGTGYIGRLGQRASHGCVRLHPSNAATLFDLVRSRGMNSARVVVSNVDYAMRPARKPESTARRAAPPARTAEPFAPAAEPSAPAAEPPDPTEANAATTRQ